MNIQKKVTNFFTETRGNEMKPYEKIIQFKRMDKRLKDEKIDH